MLSQRRAECVDDHWRDGTTRSSPSAHRVFNRKWSSILLLLSRGSRRSTTRGGPRPSPMGANPYFQYLLSSLIYLHTYSLIYICCYHLSLNAYTVIIIIIIIIISSFRGGGRKTWQRDRDGSRDLPKLRGVVSTGWGLDARWDSHFPLISTPESQNESLKVTISVINCLCGPARAIPQPVSIRRLKSRIVARECLGSGHRVTFSCI